MSRSSGSGRDNTTATATGGSTGNRAKRKGATSPTYLFANSTTNTPTSPRPKIKILLKNNDNNSRQTRSKQHQHQHHPSSTTPTRSNTRTSARGRTTIPSQKSLSSKAGSPFTISEQDKNQDQDQDDESDLTPQSSDNEDYEISQQDEDLPEPSNSRKSKHDSNLKHDEHAHSHTPTRRSSHIGVNQRSTKGKEKEIADKDLVTRKNLITQNGPQGRNRKRVVKAGQVERRRARDEKFGMGTGPLSPNSNITYTNHEAEDDVSSYGDDESDHGYPKVHTDVDEDDINSWLPEAFAGQDIEDLAYGAGPADLHIPRGLIGGWVDEHDEEDEEDHALVEDGEDEDPAQMAIDHLSGSEAERQSQSSVGGNDSDVIMSDSDISSSSEDEVDEYGFPIPTSDTAALPSGDSPVADGPLILMENWDGQFVLVQPRSERSRSRKGDRGSRTAGSVGGSTVLSSGDQNALVIDADAEEREFDSDASSWSGMSDEEDDGGDTTDSMAEEDMPMLDSPALQQLMSEQIGHLDMNADVGSPLSLAPHDAQVVAPSIVITDTTQPLPETPALSTTATTPGLPGPSTAAPPATPQAPGPVMGTFHPTTDDPASHAVIDGSGQATKSPFTHRKKTLRGRGDSFASTRTSVSRDDRERKRKTSMDIFSSPKMPIESKLPKKARYSSIPGHPRYIRARRAEALQDADRETTPSDSEMNGAEAFSLEDMLDTSLLMHEYEATHSTPGHHDDDDHLRHLIRFDRIPVSTYLRRNFLSSAGRVETTYQEEYITTTSHHHPQAFSSPLNRMSSQTIDNGFGYSNDMSMALGMGMTATLAGPLGGRGMLTSPILEAVGEDRGEIENNTIPTSRRERRRAKRRNIAPVAPLQI